MARARVDVLGPLRLVVGGHEVDVRGPKRRAVLAVLALAEGRPVTTDHLVDALWPLDPPGSGRQALHSLVSRLRAQLGQAGDQLLTLPDGYRLDLGEDGLDLSRARALHRRATVELAHDPPAALRCLEEARSLWRGPVLADLPEVADVTIAAQAIERLRQEVADALVATAVRAGRAASVVGLAAEAVADDPLREQAVVLQMRALTGAGEARAALQAARAYRRRLAAETGLDASPALDAAEQDAAGGGRRAATVDRGTAPAPGSLFGRQEQLAALHRLLASERLVTVVGPGGVGKTSVALEVAAAADSAHVLRLAPVTDPAAVPYALADALGLTVGRGDVLLACVAVLQDRTGLLVVDNCEHLVDAARDMVATLLRSCPGLTVLATSRESLGLPYEHVSRLVPLAVPRPGQLPAESPAVELFLDRAARVRPEWAPTVDDLDRVAGVVRRLEGLPLAIELAAGRLTTLSLGDLSDRLDRALDLLGSGRPSVDARHRSLRAAVDWSYQLLAEEEQRLFRHLAVFPDGVDLRTAERVARELGTPVDPAAALARLVDTSMVGADFTEGARYRMLAPLRAFGIDRLVAAGERTAAVVRLVSWAVDLTRWFDDTSATEREAVGDAALRRELPNVRAAWRAARDRRLLGEASLIVASLFDAVVSRDLVEVRAWARELADDPALPGLPNAAAVLGAAAYAAYTAGEQDRAEAYARRGLAEGGAGVAHCRHALAVIALARGAWDDAVEHCMAPDAMARPRHGFLGIAALASAYAGDLARARALNAQWSAQAGSPSRRAWAAYYEAEIESLSGRKELAEPRYVEAVSLGRSAGDSFVVGVATVGLQTLRALDGRVPEALSGYREVIDLFARTGYWTHQWIALRNLAALLRRLGDAETADAIDAAERAAPDAPAAPPSSRQLALVTVDRPAAVAPVPGVPGRTEVLELARRAIDSRLTRT